MNMREDSENYLLRLASRVNGAEPIHMLCVLVQEHDGSFSTHRAKFSENGNWLEMIGNLAAFQHSVINDKVEYTECNADGSALEEE